MGRSTRHKHIGTPLPHGPPGCMWGLFHLLKYHHWRHIRKRLTYMRHGDKKHGAENLENDIRTSNAEGLSSQSSADVTKAIVEAKAKQSTTATKTSVKSRIKALITEERFKKKGKHQGSSTNPTPSPPTKTESFRHSEQPHVNNPVSEITLHDESLRVAEQNKESSSAMNSMDQVLPHSSEELITSDEDRKESGIISTEDELRHDKVDESGKQPAESGMHPQEDLDQTKQELTKWKLKHAEELTKYASAYQSKQLVDALDIISMNKEFLCGILQDPGSPLAQHFHKQQAMSAKMRLTKSESFPLPGSSSKRDSGPSRLMLKEDSIVPHAKEEEFQAQKPPVNEFVEEEFQAQKSPVNESVGDIYKSSMPLIAAEYRADGIMKLNQAKAEIADSSFGSSHHLKKLSENKVVIKRFKDLKQKIKYAIKESKKERRRITMDAILHKIPHTKGFSKDLTKEIVDVSEDPSKNRNNFTPSTSKPGLRNMRRTSSLNESMDRYLQLYESSFNREAKQTTSDTERLKSGTEEAASHHRSASKFFGRVLSSPELNSYYSFQSGGSPDAFSSDMPISTAGDNASSIGSLNEQKSLDLPTASEYQFQLDTLQKSDSQENMIDFSEICSITSDHLESMSVEDGEAVNKVENFNDELRKSMIRASASHSEHEIGHETVSTAKLEEPASPVLLFDSKFEMDSTRTSQAESPVSEIKQSHCPPDELDFLSDPQHESHTDATLEAKDRDEHEKADVLRKESEKALLHFPVDAKDKAKFDYVRDVLELSGFSGNEILGTWHSDDQPVDPLVYEEVGGCMFCDLNCIGNEEDGGNCEHLLLFDLINEVLMEIYERSYSYCPVPLSSLSSIRPMPEGYHVLEEAWSNISWYLSFRIAADQQLHYVVSRDLARSDGWMNLQFDTECVGLELEDWIFDDLLDELISI